MGSGPILCSGYGNLNGDSPLIHLEIESNQKETKTRRGSFKKNAIF